MTKHILITGASSGIGRNAVILLARSGYTVWAGVRKQSDVESIRDEKIDTLQPILIDVSDNSSIAQAATTIEKSCGSDGLFALVNNAGIVVSSPLEFVPLDQLRTQFDVNVTGQVAVTQAMLPMLRTAKGRIIFTGSSSGYFAAPFVGPYAASKYAIEAIADSLRRELAPWNIPVINIQPGAIATPIWDKSEKAADSLLEGFPPKAHQLYGERMAKVKGEVASISGSASPASAVSKTILKALRSNKPKTRYRVGRDATFQLILARLVPTRWVDWLISKAL